MMPAFSDWPQHAAVIGRILAGYGELEFRLSKLVGYAMSAGVEYSAGHRKALRALFEQRGEAARLKHAHLLVAGEMRKVVSSPRRNVYEDAKKAMDECREFRNMFAHCHFDTLKHGRSTDGLFFVELEDAVNPKREKSVAQKLGKSVAKKRVKTIAHDREKSVARELDTIEFRWQSASYKRLREIEAFFDYTATCLEYVDVRMWTFRFGRSGSSSTDPRVRREPIKVNVPPRFVAASQAQMILLSGGAVQVGVGDAKLRSD
jgi:hypothetical protein